MDDPASNLAKAITEYVKDTTQKYSTQQTAQEDQQKRLDTLDCLCKAYDARVSNLEAKLTETERQLGESRQNESELSKSIDECQNKVTKMQAKMKEYDSCLELITILTSKFHMLEKSNEQTQASVKGIHQDHVSLAKQVQRLQQEKPPTMPSPQNHYHRPPVRSPSATSYFNGYSPVPRHVTKNTLPSYLKTSPRHQYEVHDPNDELDEVESLANSLKEGVNDLHRSYEEYYSHS